MAEVTFPVELGGDGNTYTDDASPTTGMAAGGHRIRFVPALSQAVIMTATAKSRAEAAQAFRNESVAARNAAQTSETNAASSAASANSSKNAAATSAANAKTSETNAASSASAANTSKNAAATSAANAKTSETNAGGSATSANASKNAAKTSETNAASSASAANSSKNAAAGSASAASTSATNAASSASSASSSASSATASKNAAATSASNASTSAGAALASKNAAATSESNAASSASSATASKNAAASSASNAATSETNAAASASSASADAASIANSETLVTGLRGETVAAAQDVQQYADLLDDLATLDWNFTTGKYSRDNGDRVETTNLSELATVTRPDAKQVFGPNGFQRSAIAGAVARQWNPVTGVAEGVVQEKVSKNLLKASEAIGSGVWNRNSNNTKCSASVKKSPDGAYTATRISKSGAYAYRGQNFNGETGQTLCLSVYVHAGSLNSVTLLLSGNVGTGGALEGRLRFDFDTATINDADSRALVDSGMEDVGDGWFRVWLAATLQTGQNPSVFLYPGLYNDPAPGDAYFWGAQLELGDKPTSYIPTPATFESRASSGTYFDSNGVLQTAAIDEPRENHVQVDGEWVSQGLLIEPEAKTNLLLWSEAFDNAVWGGTGRSVSATAIPSPDDTSTAYKLVEDASNGLHFIQSAVITSTGGATYSASVYVKKGEKSKGSLQFTGGGAGNNPRADFDLDAETFVIANAITSLGIEKLNNGWFRLYISTTTPSSAAFAMRVYTANASGTTAYQGDGTSGLYIWGAQLEEGTQPSSYIKTTDAPVTRAADVVSSVEVERGQDELTAPLTGEYNPRQGTWVIDAEHNDVAPLTGIGLDGAYTSGKGKLVYSYDENGGEAFANGAKAFDTPPVKKAQNVSLGHQTTGRVQYFPKKLSMAQAIARATGAVEVDYPFADGRSLYTNFATNDYGVQAIDNAVDTLRSDNASDVLTVERATSKWVLKEHGLYEEVPVDTIAREWNPETGEYAALIEGSATNILRGSADTTRGYWSKQDVTASVSTRTAPDGTMCSRITETTTTAFHYIAQNPTISAGEYVGSVFVMKASTTNKIRVELWNSPQGSISRIDLNTQTGEVTSVTGVGYVEDYGEFLRISVVGTATVDTLSFRVLLGGGTSYEGDGTSYLDMWNSQLEQGTRPSSPIITTDAPKTRAADNPKRVLGSELNPNAFSFIADCSLYQTEGFSILVSFASGFASNEAVYLQLTPTGSVQLIGQQYFAAMNLLTNYSGQRLRIGVSLTSSGQVVVVLNGVLVGTRTSTDLRPLRRRGLGTDSRVNSGGNTAYCQFAHYKEIPYAMTEAQLQEETTL